MSRTITKAELITEIAHQTGQTKGIIADVLTALENTAQAALKNGDAVTIPGLVKLTPMDKAARVGRNPATGEACQIPAKRVVKAKPVSTILN